MLRPAVPRNVYAFGFTSFFNDIASEMAYWVLPAFLASIGAGPAQLGVIEGIAESVAAFAQLLSGQLADRLPRRKPLVVGGYFVANVVKPLLALATSWWQILAVRFADRFAKGIRGTARDVMVAESVTSETIGSAYGLIQAMDSAGAIAGPLLALAILAYSTNVRLVFWAAAVPGALCVLVAVLGIRETTRERMPRGDERQRDDHTLTESSGETRLDAPLPAPEELTRANALVPPLPAGFYYVLVAATLFSLGNSSDMFLVLRAQNVGIPVVHAPLLGLVFNIMFTLFSWPAGHASDRLPRNLVAAAGYVVFAVVYFVFAMAPTRAAIWAAMSIYGLYYALTAPVLKALVVDTVAASVRGRALGVYSVVTSVATLLASLITGELWKLDGARMPLLLSAGMAMTAAMLLAFGSIQRAHA